VGFASLNPPYRDNYSFAFSAQVGLG
jgi:hypothetical protein